MAGLEIYPKRQTFGTVLRRLSEDLPKSLLDGLLFGLGQDGFLGLAQGLAWAAVSAAFSFGRVRKFRARVS